MGTVTATITVPGRFNGPHQSGNGGYSSGVFAASVDGPAAVSLRSPVPLDRPLQLRREEGVVRAFDGETLIAEVEPAAPLQVEVPAPVSAAEAGAASEHYLAPSDGPFSCCFVCGPAREDSFGVFAGPVEGRDLVASTWTPPAWSADESGAVRPEFIWAVLDCPSYFAIYREEMVLAFLVRQQSDIHAPVRAGVEHVVVSWPLPGNEGRKNLAGSAILDTEGNALAVAEGLWVEPRA